ncbi:CvfB family protein [Longirhabdus pacifica]|uniref:CvfB family protein n=1 Tax=Longirhabdus pacifica TaxID=2305227 RepID=UPI0010087DE5|nr:S1-like domain-containing RNA-binding protein [Longirhabdus pacifica]
MMYEAGTFATLEVVKKEVFGYFLSNGESNVLLHETEITEPIDIGDHIKVFLLHDTEDRLSASMKTPLLSYGEVASLKVVDSHPRFGLFLDMGLSRHLLLPKKFLPELEEHRPQIGDDVLVQLSRDKQGRMLAQLAGEYELEAMCFHAPQSWKNRELDAQVYKVLRIGSFVLIEGGVLGFGALGFLHETEHSRTVRVGERVKVRVTHVREDGRVNVSMRPLKQVEREQFADELLAFLKKRPNGGMPYSDATPAEIIKQRFQVSKSSFKRAIGRLLKEDLIYQEGDWTYLKNKEQDNETT